MIKTIIFDLNRVLVAYKNLNAEYKRTFGITQSRFWRPLEEFFGDHVMGKTSLDYFLIKILEKNNLDKDNLLEAKRIYKENIYEVKGMSALLGSLKKNYSLILAAGDGKGSLEMKLEKFNLMTYFKDIYATCYMGLIKTDPAFYKEILNRSKIVPGETIFIDDRQSHLDVAKKLEINTILFDNLPKLKNDLKKLNIIFE